MKHRNIRIGIPRALLYHSYAGPWTSFFGELGYDVITSPETTAGILKEGVKKSVGDLCLPVKIFLGHVECLKDSTDYLFIPRYVSIEDDAYMCPKIIGLPDMVRASIPNLPKVVAPMLHIKKDKEKTLACFSKQMASILSLEYRKVEKILPAIFEAQLNKTDFSGRPDLIFPEESAIRLSGKDSVNIGITGRPYLLFDKYTGKNILNAIREFGANPVLAHPPEKEIREAMTIIPKWVYWSMGKEVVTSAHVFFKDENIDGVINICSAACGPDSFTGDLIRKRLNPGKKPYMSLSLDEHSSDVGVQTRIEAFIDMLRKVTA